MSRIKKVFAAIGIFATAAGLMCFLLLDIPEVMRRYFTHPVGLPKDLEQFPELSQPVAVNFWDDSRQTTGAASIVIDLSTKRAVYFNSDQVCGVALIEISPSTTVEQGIFTVTHKRSLRHAHPIEHQHLSIILNNGIELREGMLGVDDGHDPRGPEIFLNPIMMERFYDAAVESMIVLIR